MSLINNDLNIFYSGGSGGFYLLHYILLFKQHWCALEFPNALQHIVDHGSRAQHDQLRLSSTTYADCSGPDWPSYAEYNQLYPRLDQPVKSELEKLHTAWGHNVDFIDQGFDTKLKLIFDYQWNIQTTSKWKQGEIWPNNSVTLAESNPPRPYKIFFSCMSPDSDVWPEYPGKKILIYTDIKSQLRLTRSKNAGWFFNENQPTTTTIKKFMRQAFAVNDLKIYNRLQSHVNTADHAVYLQDLVANPESVLGTPVTNRHQQFTRHWKNCHPRELLLKTGLDQTH